MKNELIDDSYEGEDGNVETAFSGLYALQNLDEAGADDQLFMPSVPQVEADVQDNHKVIVLKIPAITGLIDELIGVLGEFQEKCDIPGREIGFNASVEPSPSFSPVLEACRDARGQLAAFYAHRYEQLDQALAYGAAADQIKTLLDVFISDMKQSKIVDAIPENEVDFVLKSLISLESNIKKVARAIDVGIAQVLQRN